MTSSNTFRKSGAERLGDPPDVIAVTSETANRKRHRDETTTNRYRWWRDRRRDACLHLAALHQVTLFEAGEQLGGHAFTHTLIHEGKLIHADMGAEYFTERLAPNLMAHLKALDVGTFVALVVQLPGPRRLRAMEQPAHRQSIESGAATGIRSVSSGHG